MRKRRTYTRRGAALRWLAFLLGLFALLSVMGVYRILPQQAIRQLSQSRGVRDTEIVSVVRGQGAIMKNKLLTVSENEQALMLCALEFNPFTGWQSVGIGQVIIKDDPEDRDGYWQATKRDLPGENWLCLFGFVPEGEQAPALKWGFEDYQAQFGDGIYDDPAMYRVEEEIYFVDGPYDLIPAADIPVSGGRVYLHQLAPTLDDLDGDRVYLRLLAQRDGQWIRIDNYTSTSFGSR